ncbi:22572_t:CDS:2, partial [Gigaspora margarita]
AQESDKNDTSVFLKFPVNPEVVKQIEDIITAKGMGPSNPEVVKQLEGIIAAKGMGPSVDKSTPTDQPDDESESDSDERSTDISKGMGETSNQPKGNSRQEPEPSNQPKDNNRQEPEPSNQPKDNSRQETEPSNQSKGNSRQVVETSSTNVDSVVPMKGPSPSPSQETASLLTEPTATISPLSEQTTATISPLSESTATMTPLPTALSPSIIQTPPIAKTSALPPPIAKTQALPPPNAKTPTLPSIAKTPTPNPKSPIHTSSHLPATSTSKVSLAEHITIDNFFLVTFTTFLCYFVGNFVILF